MKKILLILFVMLLFFIPESVSADRITTDAINTLTDKLTDSRGKPYVRQDHQYFSVDTTGTLSGATWAKFAINPAGFGPGISSDTYMLLRMVIFAEAVNAGEATQDSTLTDTVTIYLSSSNDSLPTNPTKWWWGPFTIAGEDCTYTTKDAASNPNDPILNLWSTAAGNAALNARLASYPFKWKWIPGSGTYVQSTAELDALTGNSGAKILFRDIPFVPPLAYKNANSADSLVYVQIKPLLKNGTDPDSIWNIRLRLEGYRLDVPN